MQKIISISLCFFFFTACSGLFISHDENLAGKEALQFVNKAFVDRDLDSAYALLAQDTKTSISLQKVKDTTVQMHPALYPTSVQAQDFEPIPGQKAMSIYVVGENGDEKFYYRIIMSGTSETGYKPAGFFRDNGPQPRTKLMQKLEPPQ